MNINTYHNLQRGNQLELKTFKCNVSCTDGKISVSIIYFYCVTYFSTGVVPNTNCVLFPLGLSSLTRNFRQVWAVDIGVQITDEGRSLYIGSFCPAMTSLSRYLEEAAFSLSISPSVFISLWLFSTRIMVTWYLLLFSFHVLPGRPSNKRNFETQQLQ